MPRTAADFVLVLHFLWVLFMLVGFPLAWLLRSRGLRLVHALGLAAYLGLAVAGRLCPLTVAEEALRRSGGADFSYSGSFLAAWIQRLIYVETWHAPLWLFQVLAAGYLAVVLSSWWWWPRRGGS